MDPARHENGSAVARKRAAGGATEMGRVAPFLRGIEPRGAWLVRVDCGREGVGCLVVAAIHWSLCSQDVVVHRRRVTFHLMQPVLDHITDRYDSDQLPLVDHGDVAESSLGHAFHDVEHTLVLVAGRDFAGHRLAHRLLERCRAAFGERTHNVSFGEDTDDATVGAENEHRADSLLDEESHGGGETGTGCDGDDLAAFGSEDNADGHRGLPRLHSAAARRGGAATAEGGVFKGKRPSAGMVARVQCTDEPRIGLTSARVSV